MRVVMWADNYWLFRDSKERLACKVNDIIAELLDLDMDPKPESLWWTSTHHAAEKMTLSVGYRGLAWDFSFKDVFEVLGYLFHRDGMGFQGADRTMCKGLGSWWRDRYIYRSKSVSMHAKCRRACMGGQNLASYLSCSDVCRRMLGASQEEDNLFFAHQVEENGSAHRSRKDRGKGRPARKM